MKKYFIITMLAAMLLVSCKKYNDAEIRSDINELKVRVERLEKLCSNMNTNISSFQAIVTALQNRDAVVSVTELPDNKGYTILFASGKSIFIYNGKDGCDGKDGADGQNGLDGHTPSIGIKQGSDGMYYWTLDGEWIVDDSGNKIKAEGTNGKDGKNGTDAITPRLKIEEDYWFVSYDNGVTWVKLNKATGKDGMDGSNITITQDKDNCYVTLPDGSVITLQKCNSTSNPDIIHFEDLYVKAICCKQWDTDYDGELSYAEARVVKTLPGFKNNTDIVSFPELKYFTSLKEIPNSAFRNCSSLWKVTLPSSIVSIGDDAFSGCTNLSYLDIPNSVDSIGNSAFSNANISRLIIPDEVLSIGESVYSSGTFGYLYIGSSLVKMPAGQFREAKIDELILNCNVPDGHTNGAGYDIGYFHNCRIDKVIFGREVRQIGSYAMGGAKVVTNSLPGVKTVVLGECVERIGIMAFYDNTLSTVYCKSITPPSLASAAFPSSNQMVIYVPIGSEDSYKSAPVWKSYSSKIKGYDFENNPIN